MTTPTIQVESTAVAFEMEDGRIKKLPASYGTFHDPSGTTIPKCTIYFGPFRKTRERVDMNRAQRRYFGPDHKAFLAVIPKLSGKRWTRVGRVVQIFYKRRGVRAPYGFFHPFKSREVTLERSGKLYRILLGNCLVDDRGYVYP
jgi:hypothetical protein